MHVFQLFNYSKRDLEAMEVVMSVPESFIITPYENFMFKDAIFNTIAKMRELKDEKSVRGQYLPLNVLSLMLLIEIRVDKSEVVDIFPQYVDSISYTNRSNFIVDYINSLPTVDTADVSPLWNDEDLKYYNSITLKPMIIKERPLDFFNKFIDALKESKFSKEADYLIKNVFVSSEQFQWAFSMAQSRAYSFSYKMYTNVTNRENFSQEENDINLNHIKKYSSAMIACFDIPNHIFPINFNASNLNSFKMFPSKGKLGMSAKFPIKANSEYGYVYNPEMDSNHMIYSYGFTIMNNPGEFIFLQAVNILKNFTSSCLKLCHNLDWVPKSENLNAYYSRLNTFNATKEPNDILFTLAKYEEYNTNFLMMWRVNRFSNDQCSQSSIILNNLFNYNYISFYNEIYATVEAVDTLANFLFTKRLINKDEEELKQIQEMINKNDYSK